eukprot:2806068-Karenia_brevis.AAC.1
MSMPILFCHQDVEFISYLPQPRSTDMFENSQITYSPACELSQSLLDGDDDIACTQADNESTGEVLEEEEVVKKEPESESQSVMNAETKIEPEKEVEDVPLDLFSDAEDSDLKSVGRPIKPSYVRDQFAYERCSVKAQKN